MKTMNNNKSQSSLDKELNGWDDNVKAFVKEKQMTKEVIEEFLTEYDSYLFRGGFDDVEWFYNELYGGNKNINMNNEKYNQTISEIYSKYLDYLQENEIHGIWYDLETFINTCKIDNEFSEKWGLKIEERELSLEERRKEMESIGVETVIINMFFNKTLDLPKQEMYEKKIPTKLITVTYKDETIEIYE